MPAPDQGRNLELLARQIERSLDPRGRIVDCDGLTIARSTDGQTAWIGDAVPDDVAADLAAALAQAAAPGAPSEPPPGLAACERLLASGGALERSCGPSYVFPSGVRGDAAITIERPDGAVEHLRGTNPGNWHPVEWDELLDGRLGPWTMVVQGGRPLSICHTPGAMTARAAECGVWTEPEFRGRGYAAATAAAWVPLVAAPQRTLFYSTDADNISSQRVAHRLHLVEIGWTWRLRRVRNDHGPHLHPLCSLYGRAP